MVLFQILATAFHFSSTSAQYHKGHSSMSENHQDLGCHIVKQFSADTKCPQMANTNLKSIIGMDQC